MIENIGLILIVSICIGFLIMSYKLFKDDKTEFSICSFIIVVLSAVLAYSMR